MHENIVFQIWFPQFTRFMLLQVISFDRWVDSCMSDFFSSSRGHCSPLLLSFPSYYLKVFRISFFLSPRARVCVVGPSRRDQIPFEAVDVWVPLCNQDQEGSEVVLFHAGYFTNVRANIDPTDRLNDRPTDRPTLMDYLVRNFFSICSFGRRVTSISTVLHNVSAPEGTK